MKRIISATLTVIAAVSLAAPASALSDRQRDEFFSGQGNQLSDRQRDEFFDGLGNKLSDRQRDEFFSGQGNQ